MKLWLFVIVCYIPLSFSVLPYGYSPWSCWSDCDASCGDKVQSRERGCTNPPPSFPGYDCSGLGPSTEVRQCYGPIDQIDVDGGYNNWGLWSECTKDCGGGIQYRTRWCVDPHPQGKGKECSEQEELGPAIKSRSCNEHDCSEEPTEESTTEESTEGPTIEEESTEAQATEESSGATTTEEPTEATTTEESSGEPTIEEESTEEATTEESSGATTTEESTEATTTEESSVATTTEESTEATTTEESSGEPTIEEELTEETTTEESSEATTTEESTEATATEESSGAPTIEEESTEEATTEESSGATTTEESTETTPTEESSGAQTTEELTEATTALESTEAPTLTTGETTETPVTEELTTGPPCIKALDLAIIIDKSKSVGKGNLRRLKRNLVSFLHLFEVSAQGTHVGMITFSDNADLLFDFNDDRYHTEDQLRERIKEIPLKLELKTRTDLALTLAKEKLFTVEGGDRPNVPNVCVVFTDGKSTGKPKNKGFVPIPKTVEYLTEVKKVDMLPVGIGKGIKERELEILAGDKGHYFHIGNFLELCSFLESLKDAACEYSHGSYYPSYNRRFKNIPGGLLDDSRMR